MTKSEADALAFKREQHKSKHLTAKRWAAAHDSVKGWHVALIDNHHELARQAKIEGRQAYLAGDVRAFMDAATKHLLATCAAAVAEIDKP